MPSEIRQGQSFELSTQNLGPSRGLSSLQELFDTKVQLRFQADPDQRIDARMTVHGLPGVRYANMVSSMNVSLVRHRMMLSDQEDDLCLIMNAGQALHIEQGKRQSLAMTGEAVLLDYSEPATLSFQAMNYAAIRVPRAALAPLAKGAGVSPGHHVRRDATALMLLRAYLASLPAFIADPMLKGLVATHVYDLMALALGASAGEAEIATQRGLKAARLQAAKAALIQDRELSIQDIARRQAITPRYVQMLFEESGTTYTDFVLALRLEAARAMLVSPRFKHWKIAAIAQEAGFGDLSHFNRRFKARYDQTPSDARARSILPT
jgi:AraC-like DNA-binding protein